MTVNNYVKKRRNRDFCYKKVKKPLTKNAQKITFYVIFVHFLVKKNFTQKNGQNTSEILIKLNFGVGNDGKKKEMTNPHIHIVINIENKQ